MIFTKFLFFCIILKFGFCNRQEIVYESSTPQTVITGCQIISEELEILKITYYIIDATGKKKFVNKSDRKNSIEVIWPKPSKFPAFAQRKLISFSDICFHSACKAQKCGKIIGPLIEDLESLKIEVQKSDKNIQKLQNSDAHSKEIVDHKCTCENNTNLIGLPLMDSRNFPFPKSGSGEWRLSKRKQKQIFSIINHYAFFKGSFIKDNTIFYPSCNQKSFKIPAVKNYCPKT